MLNPQNAGRDPVAVVTALDKSVLGIVAILENFGVPAATLSTFRNGVRRDIERMVRSELERRRVQAERENGSNGHSRSS